MLANNRLVKSKRLRCSKDFKHVFQQGIKLKQGCLTTYTRPNNLGYARLGLAITKKAVPNATSRNRVKRVIREHFRIAQRLLPSIDLVIAVKSQCLSNKQILSCDLDKQWSRLVIYYKKA